MSDVFRFKQFEVSNGRSALKVGTDAVLLGAAMTLPERRPLRLLDIGTGTGVIAMMAAQRLRRGFHIDAVDIDGPSAEEAAGNFASSQWASGLSAFHTALSGFRPEGGDYDLIFSNPPYFESSLVNPDAREAAARHTGSLSYREICAFAATHLAPEGSLSMILPSDALPMLLRTAASFGLHPFRELDVRTTPSKPPKRAVVEFSRKRCVTTVEEIVLQDGNTRSEAYSALTADFYL